MFKKALNHMTTPDMRWDDFLKLASELGCVGVEFRNDLQGPLFEGDAPEKVALLAAKYNLEILALAEVKMFNDWSDKKAVEANQLMRFAKVCGAKAVSLIARNDGKRMGEAERIEDLQTALSELLPMLKDYDLLGMVEPLGFELCNIRNKIDTVNAIDKLGAHDTFKIVHDTFHHHLAGGGELYPKHTGIIHISGVVDPSLSVERMGDEHRILVDADDRLGNVVQLEIMMAAGFDGPVSFEAFSPQVHEMSDPLSEIQKSFEFIQRNMKRSQLLSA